MPRNAPTLVLALAASTAIGGWSFAQSNPRPNPTTMPVPGVVTPPQQRNADAPRPAQGQRPVNNPATRPAGGAAQGHPGGHAPMPGGHGPAAGGAAQHQPGRELPADAALPQQH